MNIERARDIDNQCAHFMRNDIAKSNRLNYQCKNLNKKKMGKMPPNIKDTVIMERMFYTLQLYDV